MKQKRAQLLVDATEEAPEVKEVDQQIVAVQKHLNETRTRKTSTLLTNLETKYRQSLSREQALAFALLAFAPIYCNALAGGIIYISMARLKQPERPIAELDLKSSQVG